MRIQLERAKWNPLPFRGGRKIAYLKTTLGYGVKAGGSVGHVAGVVNALLHKGNSVEIFANEVQPLVEPHASFFQLVPPSLFAYPAELNLVRFHHSVVKAVHRQFGEARPDWIYQRLSTSNFAGAILSLQHQLPLVVEYNGSEVWIAKNWGEGMPFESLSLQCEDALLRQATLVVTVSEVLGEELRGRGIPTERVFVHPNCVDPARYRPDLLTPLQVAAIRREINLDPDDLVLTFLGTFGAWHGVDFLAEAIRELYSGNPEWWERHRVAVVMVGDGVLKSKVQTELRDIPRIRFTGLVPQESAPNYLAISDILLSPHVDRRTGERFFGSPTKLFEYMAVGKCVIASELEQIGEVMSPAFKVGEGFDPRMVGVLFQPGNHREFIEAIRWAVEHPSERIQLGRSARSKAIKEFTWELFAERLVTKLQTLR
ncbi:MAG TPA: glycosyltransferase family 4 protein [Holophagaceae bacterium]|nr:glycosyltransferase family 4 protein [Holophagaceae bacterium]